MKSQRGFSVLHRLKGSIGIPVCLALLLLVSFVLPAAAQSNGPASSHLVLVIDENTSFTTALANMPWLVSQGSANGYAANYKSDTSGSLMDYLWLASGSCESSANCALPAGTHNFGCSGNSCSSPITDDNIFREMNNLGISWKVYAQSYAAAGGKVTSPDNANGTHYYRRHNGATWYSDILSNVDGSQAKIVDFSQFAADLANNALPRFSIIVPDGLNDAHDTGPVPADAFLKANLPPMLAKSYFQPGGDGLLIITFDNGDNDGAGLVYTALIGPNVTPKTVSNAAYKHENTLRTMLEALGIATYPGASATAAAMTDFFHASAVPSSGSVTIASPVQGAVTAPQVPVTASASESNAQIARLEVWDTTTGQKLADSAPGSSSINQVFTLAPGPHQILVQDIAAAGVNQILHKASVDITVAAGAATSSGEVTIAAPVQGSTSGTQVRVTASATAANATINHLEVWDTTTGQKLGNSPAGPKIDETFTLAPGLHQLVVESISSSWQVLNKATVPVSVATAPGVTILAPANNSSQTTMVTIHAFANSSSAIDHLEVWDTSTGTKLVDAFGTEVDAAYNLFPGKHTIVVESVSTAYQVLAKSSVTVDVN